MNKKIKDIKPFVACDVRALAHRDALMRSLSSAIITSITLAALLASPAVILADINPGSAPSSQNLNITQIINIVLNFIWPLFVGFAVLMFIVAGFQFLTAQGDPSKVDQARMSVLWGVVGVVVGVIAFSIPFIVRNTLGF